MIERILVLTCMNEVQVKQLKIPDTIKKHNSCSKKTCSNKLQQFIYSYLAHGSSLPTILFLVLEKPIRF